MKPNSGGLRSIFRATAILSASTGVTILIGLVTSKVNAVFLGPKGYGYVGLFQSMVNVAVLVAGLGIGSGLVRFGASRGAQNDHVAVAKLCQGARLILYVTSVVVLVSVLLFRHTLSVWFLGTPEFPWSVALMGIVIALTLGTRLMTSILNTYHRVEALAKNSVMDSVLCAVSTILIIIGWREKGIVASIIAASIVSWLVARYSLYKSVGHIQVPTTTLYESVHAAASLIKFGGPYTASMMVGTGVQLMLPVLVLHMLGPDDVGYYRAAVSISVTYLGFLITAMAQDYFPRVSAASDQPRELVDLINKQQRLVLLLGVPMILGTLAMVPLLVPLVYSLKFAPTAEILEWQLIGDIFKFSSWTMSFVILARCSSLTYFVAEAVGGISILATSWLGIKLFGVAGLGISFVVAYFIYYLVVWIIVRREISMVFTKSNKLLLLAAVCAGIFVRLLSYSPLRGLRTPIGLALALAAGAWSILAIVRDGGHIAILDSLRNRFVKLSAGAVVTK